MRTVLCSDNGVSFGLLRARTVSCLSGVDAGIMSRCFLDRADGCSDDNGILDGVATFILARGLAGRMTDLRTLTELCF